MIVTLVAKNVSEIIYNKTVPDVSVAITDLLQGKWKKHFMQKHRYKQDTA